MSILIGSLQNRVKNSAAYAEELGLMLIANGEEKPYLLSATGEKITTGITPPSVAPTVTDNGAGTLTAGKFVTYQIVYVNENGFPLIAARLYSNPSPQRAYTIAGTVVAASGTLTLTAITSHNAKRVIIGNQIYTFETTFTDTAYNILIGADITASIFNLTSAIMGAAGEGIVYGTGTKVNPQVTATAAAGVMTATAKTAGVVGNSIVTTETLNNGSWGAATLTGGLDDARKNTVAFNGVADSLVTHIYIYRTSLQDTAQFAQIAADAGLLTYVGKVANVLGALTFLDNQLTIIGNEPIQYINFVSSQFRFVVWDGNYFWGFGNHPFSAAASWDATGVITLANPSLDQFFGGRDGQYLTFSSISTGGSDNRGTFFFKQTGAFTGQAVNAAGANVTLPSTTTGNIVLIGESATLYRSGYRNPFQWGYLKNFVGTFIPSLWALKISGSLGTAIAIFPDQQLLKLDMEFPALCLTYSLQTADTEVFSQTKRQLSRLYSVTSHFSQFVAIAGGRQVLWGFDAKNSAIVQCDGYTQVPISSPISILLRDLSKNRSLHLLTHGIYDPATEINAVWLSSSEADKANAPSQFDLCVYQHAPTGYWGVIYDYGILCSSAIEDPVTSQRNTLVGTENGFVGKAFDTASYGNWLPTQSPYQGFINSATATSITRSEGQDDFDPIEAGLIGNFCLIVDPDGLRPQVCKITNVTADSLFFAQTLDPLPTTSTDPGLIDGQWKFFIGLIELRVVKYFDVGAPSVDKTPREYWATLSDANLPHVEFYAEHTEIPLKAIPLKQDDDTDAWQNKFDFPVKKGKTFGLALVERSYGPTKFFNFTVK